MQAALYSSARPAAAVGSGLLSTHDNYQLVSGKSVRLPSVSLGPDVDKAVAAELQVCKQCVRWALAQGRS